MSFLFLPTVKYVPPPPPPVVRPPSPRVKPATHYARVVSNIILDVPCSDPPQTSQVYANSLDRIVFYNPFHSDQIFQSYFNNAYGAMYRKNEAFKRNIQNHYQVGCAASLWGNLPITCEKISSQYASQNLIYGDTSNRIPHSGLLPFLGQSKSIFMGGKTGTLDTYAAIHGNMQKLKHNFRDEARVKGNAHPSKAEVTNRLIKGTSKDAKRRLDRNTLNERDHTLNRQGHPRNGYANASKVGKKRLNQNSLDELDHTLNRHGHPRPGHAYDSKVGKKRLEQYSLDERDHNLNRHGHPRPGYANDSKVGKKRLKQYSLDEGDQTFNRHGHPGPNYANDSKVGKKRLKQYSLDEGDQTFNRHGHPRPGYANDSKAGKKRLEQYSLDERDHTLNRQGPPRPGYANDSKAGKKRLQQYSLDDEDERPGNAARKEKGNKYEKRNSTTNLYRSTGRNGLETTNNSNNKDPSSKINLVLTYGEYGDEEYGDGEYGRVKSSSFLNSKGSATNVSRIGRRSSFKGAKKDVARKRRSQSENGGTGRRKTQDRTSQTLPTSAERGAGDKFPRKNSGALELSKVSGIDIATLHYLQILEEQGGFDETLADGDYSENQRMLAAAKNNTFGAMYGKNDAFKRNHYQVGCAASLWGKLPIPCEKIFSEPPPQNSICCDTVTHVGLPFLVPSKSVLIESNTGALNSYADIPGNIQKFKQIFRDEARTKGLARPSTAEVTNRLIERTSKVVKKRLDQNTLEELDYTLDHHGHPHQAYAQAHTHVKKEKEKKHEKRRSADKSGLETVNNSDNEEQSVATEDESQINNDGEYEDGEYGKIKSSSFTHSKGSVTNDLSGIGRKSSFKGAKKYVARKRRSQADNGEKGKRKTQDGEAQTLSTSPEVDDKLHRLTLNNSGALELKNTSGIDIVKPPSLQIQDEQERFDDMLADGADYSENQRMSTAARKTIIGANIKGRIARTISRTLKHKPKAMQFPGNTWMDQEDQLEPVPVNPCWDMASKLFKSPLQAPAIPLPENLLAHIEKKYPNLQWPRGAPVALRYYPSGQPFCVVFKNGAGRVHYPHGGLAVAISAPAQTPCRVLVIRDPFDQFYFFDRAIMADMGSNGKGTVFDESGITKVQYNPSGGYYQEGRGKTAQRWQWNCGGQRMVIKLNRYMALKIMDITKIYIVFYGNKRGVRLNIGAGQQVNLMSVACDTSKMVIINDPGRQRSGCGAFDYARGRYETPILGFLDNQRDHNRTQREKSINEPSNCPMPQYVYSFGKCNNVGVPLKHDCYSQGC